MPSSYIPQPLPLPGPYEPVAELIAQDLMQTMRDIKPVMVWYTMRDVVRWLTGPFNAAESARCGDLRVGRIVAHQPVQRRRTHDDGGGGSVVAGHAEWLDGRDMMRMRSDLYRAVTPRPDARGPCGGHRVEPRAAVHRGRGYMSICGVQLYFDIHYRHQWGNPSEFLA